jgi:high-affinity nickel permease
MTRRDARWAAEGLLAVLVVVDLVGLVLVVYIAAWLACSVPMCGMAEPVVAWSSGPRHALAALGAGAAPQSAAHHLNTEIVHAR